MTQTDTGRAPNRGWLREMAAVEDSCVSVAAGGMAADFGMVHPAAAEPQRIFGRLIEYARRAKGLSVEKLAEEAEVDLAEIVNIERQFDSVPLPRTVYQLAQLLSLPPAMLTEVAGLTRARHEVRLAALRFAARSEPTSTLTDAERGAFEEFVKVLVEVSDGGWESSSGEV